MNKPKFRKNPKTGRLEKLINGKYVAQRSAGFWKDALKVIKGTRQNVDAVGRKEGETRVNKGVRERFTKDGKWVKVDTTWTSGKRFTKAKDTSKQSPSPTRFTNPDKDKSTPKTGQYGEKNPFYTAPKKQGEDFKNTPKLEIGTKYKDNKPAATTSTKEKKNKPDELATLKKKVRRHASGKNSVQKMKWQLRIRDLEKNKKGK